MIHIVFGEWENKSAYARGCIFILEMELDWPQPDRIYLHSGSEPKPKLGIKLIIQNWIYCCMREKAMQPKSDHITKNRLGWALYQKQLLDHTFIIHSLQGPSLPTA